MRDMDSNGQFQGAGTGAVMGCPGLWGHRAAGGGGALMTVRWGKGQTWTTHSHTHTHTLYPSPPPGGGAAHCYFQTLCLCHLSNRPHRIFPFPDVSAFWGPVVSPPQIGPK